MKHYIALAFFIFFSPGLKAAGEDSTFQYNLPDSVKAVSFIADITVQSINTKKEISVGIKTETVSLYLEAEKNKREVVFEFPKSASIVAAGLSVRKEKDEIEWKYNWSPDQTYKLLIALATDSADNFSLYSGYIWLPVEKQWKLIGSCKITGQWNTIKSPSSFFSFDKKNPSEAAITNAWCQRRNGTWRKLDETKSEAPTINLLAHVDSLEQFQLEKEQIEKAIAAGSTDVKENKDGVYFKMYEQGTGRKVMLTDTVTVFYKGYLFRNGEVFDQTKEKPATFPLNRLVTGWQIALPLLNVGGKMKGVLPSALGYSIRTRAAKIPPNSTLVFEVEVVDAKPSIKQ